MTEKLLQYIWQFQYYNKGELSATAGEPLQILSPGQLNTNQGPDFSDAKIRIGTTTWAGAVELHINTSDWKKHGHQDDDNYKNVILHVVWEDDETGNALPVLELKNRVPGMLLQRYEELMLSSSFIPCEKMIHTARDITWKSWKERLLVERLLRKAKTAETYLQQNSYHWEATFWWLLARNFGMKVNADAFEAVARSLPINILARHKNQIHQLEALLLGQAGLLNGTFKEDYPVMLQNEYKFCKNKYGLRPISQPVFSMRMRPENFPAVRLAQLAMLVHHSVHLFSEIREAAEIKDIKPRFDVTANDYWHYHYRFDEISAFRKKKLGTAMTGNIIINTIAPVLFIYGNYHNGQQYKDRALRWLEETAAEKNKVTAGFEKLGIENRTACDSQALIELKNNYCSLKRCLDCAIGNSVLKQ